MIKANELRIGNRVMYCQMIAPLQGVMEEVILLPGMIEDAAERPKMYSPILLNAEVLLKYGFFKSDDELVLNISAYITLYWVNSEMILSVGQFAEATEVVPVANLHQLQNLYFALTGNELEVALK